MRRLIVVRDGTGADALKRRMQEHPVRLYKTAMLQAEYHVFAGGTLTREDHGMTAGTAVDRVQSCNGLDRRQTTGSCVAFDVRHEIKAHASQMMLDENIPPCRSNTIEDDG